MAKLARRAALTQLAALPFLGGLSVGASAAPASRRLVVIRLCGGLDGIAAVPPYGDRDYRDLRLARGTGELDRTGVIPLDGHFGLHPALAPLYPYFLRRELVVVTAVATP